MEYNSKLKLKHMIALFQLSRTLLCPAGHTVNKPDPN